MKTTRPNEPTFTVSKEMRRTYLILSHPWNALALSATVGNRLFRLLQTIKNNPACGKLLGIEADAFLIPKYVSREEPEGKLKIGRLVQLMWLAADSLL